MKNKIYIPNWWLGPTNTALNEKGKQMYKSVRDILQNCGCSAGGCQNSGNCKCTGNCNGNCGDPDCECNNSTFEEDEITKQLKFPWSTDDNNQEEEPQDNIGQSNCRFCGKPTIKKPLLSSFYEYCEYCKK